MVQNYDATAQSVPIASPGATLGTDWELTLPGSGATGPGKFSRRWPVPN